jgi:P4 family phage/plasmid primase-like protien
MVPDAIVPEQPDKLAYAMMYVGWGWHVFVLGGNRTPLANCTVCREAGSDHNAEACNCLTCHGFYAATQDQLRLEMMLQLHPNGYLAVRTGEKSGIIVVDAEGDSDGDLPSGIAVLDNWESWVDGWTLPATLTARTPSGGVHLYYRWVTGVRSRNRVLPGVDVKSDGGYVVLPCGTEDRSWLAGYDAPVETSADLSSWLQTARGRSPGGSGGQVGHLSGYDYQAFVRDGCPGGHRDEFFNDMCWRLRRVGASEDEATNQLRVAWSKAAQPPQARWHMPWEHVEYKIKRVWRTVEPDDDIPSWRGGPEPISEGGAQVVSEPLRNEFATDTGNAHRLIRLHGENLRYVPETKTWLLWDGKRWIPDRLNTAVHLTLDVSEDVRRAAEREQDNDQARQLARWALQCENSRARKSMLEIAGTDPLIAMPVDAVDRNPWLLVVKNGVLNLKTQELQEGVRSDNCTRAANVTFDPEAECPRWLEHIKLICRGKIILASYLRRAVGYSLTGLVKEQTFFMLEGSGSNGKNAFIEPVLALLGEYAQTGTSALITGGDEQHPTILADLVGSRLVFIDEARQGRALNVERVKQLTGSKRIKARRMGRDFFEFDAHLKLWIAGNNHPTMRDPSDGVWRRLHRVMFGAKIPKSQIVGDYGQILYDEEASGILNWALSGLKDYLQLNSLGQPDEVTQATQEVRDEEDFIAQFLEECCELSPDANFTPVNELYIEYSIWCGMAGIKTNDRLNRTQFGRELSGKGLERSQKRIDGSVMRGYRGVQVSRRTIV